MEKLDAINECLPVFWRPRRKGTKKTFLSVTFIKEITVLRNDSKFQ